MSRQTRFEGDEACCGTIVAFVSSSQSNALCKRYFSALYLFHGALAQLRLGNVVNVVHLEQWISFQFLHNFLFELHDNFRGKHISCVHVRLIIYVSLLLAAIHEQRQCADIERSLCSFFIHAGNRTSKKIDKC